MTAPLRVDRDQILAFRRRANALDERLPPGDDALRLAARPGLQDSMPRAALLSIHARVEGTQPDALANPALAQVWGPRFSAFVVAADDVPVFTLGRLPDDPAGLARAVDTADRLEAFLAGRRMPFGQAGHAMGVVPNALRYATTTGRVRIAWDGARQPEVWTVPPPAMDPDEARRELLRRYLHAFGPGTPEGFMDWAGIRPQRGAATFAALAPTLVRVQTPIGDGWILPQDEAALRERSPVPSAARLLPSGDAFYLLQGAERDLLVPDPARRDALWTTRVWPGALLAGGEIAGTWRRADEKVTLEPWRPLTASERDALSAEAERLPLPGLSRPIRVTWRGEGA